MIDGLSLGRAAYHARAATQHVDAARSVAVPLLFGRRAGHALVREEMAKASAAATVALGELGTGAPLADSRRAIEILRDAAAAIRDRGAGPNVHTAALTDALAGAQVHTATIDHVAMFAGGPSAQAAPVHLPSLRAAVEGMGVPLHHMPPWLAHADGELHVSAIQRASIAAAIELDPSQVASRVEELIAPIAGNQDEHLQMLAGIGLLPDSMLASLDDPTRTAIRDLEWRVSEYWNDELFAEARGITDRMWMDAIAAKPGAGEQLATELAHGTPTAATARRLGLLLEHDIAKLGIDDSIRHSISGDLMYVRTDAEAATRIAALHEARGMPTRPDLLEEARSIVGADHLTRPALDRLAVLDALPRSMRPLAEERRLQRLDELDATKLAVLHDDLRWSVERADLLSDKVRGSRLVLDEVQAFIERGDQPFTRSEVLRLARLQELGSDRGMPTLRGDAWTFREKLRRVAPDGTYDLTFPMRILRASLERARIDADPSITRATQFAELRQLLQTPDHQLEPAALRRLRSIEEVTSRKALGLPSTLRELPLAMFDDAAAGRAMAPELTTQLATIRTWLATWDVRGADDLERIARMPDRPELPPHVMEYIDHNWDALVADPASMAPLTDLVVQALNAAQGRHAGLGSTVRLADQLVRSRQPADAGALRQLYDETLETLNRNAERMDGTRHDTYDLHPDYAELGRVAANLPVLSHTPHRPASAADDLVDW